MEEFLELFEQLGEIGTQTSAPILHAGIRGRKQAHEDVRAANAVPASLASKTYGLIQRDGCFVGEHLTAKAPAGLKDVVQLFVWSSHVAQTRDARDGRFDCRRTIAFVYAYSISVRPM